MTDAFIACLVLVNVHCLDAPIAAPSHAAPLVSLEVYYETMCPDSVDFIVQQLHPTLQKIGAIMNVSLIPYGIASVSAARHGLGFPEIIVIPPKI